MTFSESRDAPHAPSTLRHLLERAALLIHDDWDGTSDDSAGNVWLRDCEAALAHAEPGEGGRADVGTEPPPQQCAACEGDGRIAVGEHFVTREMAIDGGDRNLEGQSMGIEYERCRECDGTGLVRGPSVGTEPPQHVCGKQGFQRGPAEAMYDVCPGCVDDALARGADVGRPSPEPVGVPSTLELEGGRVEPWHIERQIAEALALRDAARPGSYAAALYSEMANTLHAYRQSLEGGRPSPEPSERAIDAASAAVTTDIESGGTEYREAVRRIVRAAFVAEFGEFGPRSSGVTPREADAAGPWRVERDRLTDDYGCQYDGALFHVTASPSQTAAGTGLTYEQAIAVCDALNRVRASRPDAAGPLDMLGWQRLADEFCTFNTAASRVIMHNFAGWLWARGVRASRPVSDPKETP